jgi:predicted DNA-binding transcriptional regulator AlpA
VQQVARRSDSEWLNTTQTAEYFSVTVMTISRWSHNSELGFPQPRVINNRNYFSREACDEWIQKRTTAKTVKTVKAGA